MIEREPDYEAIMDAREDERAELYLHRMDGIYGRIEDHRAPARPADRDQAATR